MSSIRDQIVAEIVDRLNTTAGKPAAISAIRYSLSKIDLAGNPTQRPLVVFPLKDLAQPAKKGQPLIMRTAQIRIDAFSVGEPIDQQLDEQICWTTTVMSADPSLGGLCLDIRSVSEEWDEEAAVVQGYGLARTLWEVDYIHNRNNQETKP